MTLTPIRRISLLVVFTACARYAHPCVACEGKPAAKPAVDMPLVESQDSQDTNEHPVNPDQLAALIMQADKLVVFSFDPHGESFFGRTDSKILFSSTDPKDIAKFKDAVTVVVPQDSFHCMCLGTHFVQLYRGSTELVAVSNHHGRSIRCSLWTSDAMLKDREQWLRWFDARKMPEPRNEVAQMAARAKQRSASRERWLAAMPTSVRPFWGKVNVFEPDVAPLNLALAQELPKARERALLLFAWYGAGDGRWSGYPAYESVAESLLLTLPLPDLIAAAEGDNLTATQLEGAARLLSGPKFLQLLRESDKDMPVVLKKKLLEHSIRNSDAKNRSRAEDAFAH